MDRKTKKLYKEPNPNENSFLFAKDTSLLISVTYKETQMITCNKPFNKVLGQIKEREGSQTEDGLMKYKNEWN